MAIVALCLATLFSSASAQDVNQTTTTTPPSLETYLGRTNITVCTSSYTPMVYCDPETPWTEWSGYEVEVFKRVATIIGIQPEQMTWKCMAWTHMLNELQNNTVCDIAAAGIPVTTESLKMGLQFSVPTFTNGLAIAVSSSYQEASMWAFTAAFSWGVWVAIIGTSMLVGLVVFGIDAIEMGVRKNK